MRVECLLRSDVLLLAWKAHLKQMLVGGVPYRDENFILTPTTITVAKLMA